MNHDDVGDGLEAGIARPKHTVQDAQSRRVVQDRCSDREIICVDVFRLGIGLEKRQSLRAKLRQLQKPTLCTQGAREWGVSTALGHPAIPTT